MCDRSARLFDMEDPYTLSFIKGLQKFSKYYSSVHEGICMVICIFGIMSNLVHILVLTRAPLRRCAVNCVLTAVAVCDVLTMSSYVVYLLRFRFFAVSRIITAVILNRGGYPYIWIAYLLSHAVFTIALHAITLYLSVALAFIRWQALGNVHSPWLLPSSAWYDFNKRCKNSLKKLFGVCTIVVSILCIPTMLVHRIVKMPLKILPLVSEPATLIAKELYTLDMVEDACSLFQFNLWLTAIFLKHLSTLCFSRKLFGVCTIVVSILCIPTMLVHRIVKMPLKILPLVSEPATLIAKELYTLDMVEDACSLFQLNLWLTAIFLKAVPCVLLLWFTFALVSKLRDTDIKRNDLYSKSFRKHMRKTVVPDKTTYMLVIMISVFLATELPQGFLALLNGVYTADVHRFIYVNVGDVLDLMSLINCSVDCVLYCMMSSRYRCAT
uniref:G_PROTEIN_RECEP_F1_2 domain-containing protein n=1 Tax=Ascaris lumbricoides TaxID=6252 RepID=A0A0M3INY7_ASCLU